MTQLKNDDGPTVRKPSNLRRVFSQVRAHFYMFSALIGIVPAIICNAFYSFFQVLAVTIQNLLPFDMGLCIAMPIIIIGNLDLDKSLSISPSDASWIGKTHHCKTTFLY